MTPYRWAVALVAVQAAALLAHQPDCPWVALWQIERHR